MEKSKIDLLPCPFCGRKPKSIVNIQMYAIGCSFSKCHVYPCVVKKTPEEAAKAWNTRASGWIPCEERMPDAPGIHVMVTDGVHIMESLYEVIDGEILWLDNSLDLRFGKVTHWMPLPEPPETEDKA